MEVTIAELLAFGAIIFIIAYLIARGTKAQKGGKKSDPDP